MPDYIAAPTSGFIAIDFETANAFRGSPCALGIVHVEDGKIIDERSFLCRPPGASGPHDFDAFNVALHGVTWEQVRDQPEFDELWATEYPRFRDLPVVAHNAAFDIGVIRDALGVNGSDWTPLAYTCSLVLSRRVLDLPSYGLPYVADELGVTISSHHDALADARACAEIVQRLLERTRSSTLNDLLSLCRVSWGRLTSDSWRGSKTRSQSTTSLPPPRSDASPDHFLYGQFVVLTGSLPYGNNREDVLARIAHYGGQPQSGVNRKTTLLVVGDLDPLHLAAGSSISSKMRKAFALIEAGQPLEIMAGTDFLPYLD